MNRKLSQSIYNANVNVNLMKKNIIQISGEIMINVNANVKNVICVKRICLKSCYRIIFDAKCKMLVLFASVLVTIALLMAVSIYCYLIEYRAKQKHLLPFQLTNNKLKDIDIKNRAYHFFKDMINIKNFDLK